MKGIGERYEAVHAVEGVEEVEAEAVVPDEALGAGEAFGVGVGVREGEVAEVEVDGFPGGGVVGVAEGAAVGESPGCVEDEAGFRM